MKTLSLKSLGLMEQTSTTQANNGTRCFYDPITRCDYLSYESGYVRRAYISASYYGNENRTIYQLNKTKKVMENQYEHTVRIMIPCTSARLERIAHCVVVHRNNLNKK